MQRVPVSQLISFLKVLNNQYKSEGTEDNLHLRYQHLGLDFFSLKTLEYSTTNACGVETDLFKTSCHLKIVKIF